MENISCALCTSYDSSVKNVQKILSVFLMKKMEFKNSLYVAEIAVMILVIAQNRIEMRKCN